MMVQALLFIAYAAGLAFLAGHIRFFTNSGLNKKVLAVLFLLHVPVGCLHVFIAYRFFPNHGDIWEMFGYSVEWKRLLLHDYPAFVKEFFPDRFSIELSGTHIGWSYYQLQGIATIQMILNFLSNDNLYINTVIFCFLTMFGKVALYRTLRHRYPAKQRLALILAFLLPGTLFWTSVIHKEGVLFCSLGLLVFCMQRVIMDNKFSFQRAIVFAATLFIMLITRKAVLVPLVPALAIWWISEKTNYSIGRITVTVCLVMAFFLVGAGLFDSSYSLFTQISARQHEFLKLTGGSKLALPALDNTAASFVRAFPYAVLNGLLMPLPGSGGKWPYLIFSLEILAVFLIVLWSLINKKTLFDGFTVACLLFAVFSCLVIGYTVPFTGAIVRYRSILLPFVLLPFLHYEPFISSRNGNIK